MPATPTRGRPVGLLINPVAARFELGNRAQSWWANQAEVSSAHLSEMLAGTKGATPDAAMRLAEALGVPEGLLFPELVQFTTSVRHFTAPKCSEAA